ncbi:hypothetical protein C900_04172 [Fulvivirga imtechensis AK7]|uniref:BLUF domain-containing protein n=1 Tax=Fulvivirga imtechensis AK7 TaxID=1237149 RepID=L8JX15_9BACT|nr:BLUF domain-containing protein [Fulvivirga imtechensis]ELR73320.1 hypothetical protein C900_04172 [Fulvivirga imtechensis AK7]
MLSQLVYVSLRTSSCTEEEIQKILASCKRNNHDDDITGVLLYSKTHFVQYLEGAYKKIIALYDKIKEDQRHKNVVMITSGKLDSRIFPSWQMGARNFDGNDFDFKTQLAPNEREEFRSILSGNKHDANKTVDLMRKFFK